MAVDTLIFLGFEFSRNLFVTEEAGQKLLENSKPKRISVSTAISYSMYALINCNTRGPSAVLPVSDCPHASVKIFRVHRN